MSSGCPKKSSTKQTVPLVRLQEAPPPDVAACAGGPELEVAGRLLEEVRL